MVCPWPQVKSKNRKQPVMSNQTQPKQIFTPQEMETAVLAGKRVYVHDNAPGDHPVVNEAINVMELMLAKFNSLSASKDRCTCGAFETGESE